MREEVASCGFLAVTVAGLVLLFSDLVAFSHGLDFSFGDIKKRMRLTDSTRQINQMIRIRIERVALQPA